MGWFKKEKVADAVTKPIAYGVAYGKHYYTKTKGALATKKRIVYYTPAQKGNITAQSRSKSVDNVKKINRPGSSYGLSSRSLDNFGGF